MDAIERRIKDYIAKELLGGDSAPLETRVSLLETGIIDSVKLFELTTYLEESFGISVEGDDLVPENFETVEALARYVQHRLGTAA